MRLTQKKLISYLRLLMKVMDKKATKKEEDLLEKMELKIFGVVLY